MNKNEYKEFYTSLSGTDFEKIGAFVKRYQADWEIEEFEMLINDVLEASSNTVDDVLDILQLVLDQQGGNLEFKKAFFILKAEVGKSHQRLLQLKEKEKEKDKDLSFGEDIDEDGDDDIL